MNQTKHCGDRPCYPELWLMLLTSACHVVVELVWGRRQAFPFLQPTSPDQIYNGFVIVLWGSYVLWRVLKIQGMARAWGFRRDNFFAAFRLSALFSLLATAPLLLYGGLMGRLAIPATFWAAFLLYPLYGIAQQFALQVLVTKNLRGLVNHRLFRTCLAALLFSAAHFPDYTLMGLVLPAGLAFTWSYESRPNLWAVGITHGVLGSLAYYMILGLDPGAEIHAAIWRFL